MNISTIDIVILALATWRLSSLFADEDGPFRIVERLRMWVGVRYIGQDGKVERFVPDIPEGKRWPAGWILATKKTVADGMLCRWCSSVWFGIMFTGIYFIWPDVTLVALPFSLSALAILFDTVVSR